MIRFADDAAAELRHRARHCAEKAAETADPVERDRLAKKSRALLALAENEDWLAGTRPEPADDETSAADGAADHIYLLGPLAARPQQAAE